jgi:hypothetical protein
MEVIVHQTRGEDAHGSAKASFRHNVDESIVIVGLVERDAPRVPPVENVIS